MAADTYDTGGSGSWWDAQGSPMAMEGDPFTKQLTDLYAKYGQPPPPADVVESHRGNPNGLAGVEALLQQANPQAATGTIQGNDIPGPDGSGGITGRPGGPVAPANRYGDMAGFGAPPAPYASNPNAPQYEAPAVPAGLAAPYAAPTWQGGQFTAPTQAELEASPGYGARMDAGLLARNRSAAAQGTVLNGGTQKALNRYGQDYASNEYSNLFGQKMSAFGTNFGVFQTGVGNDLTARQQNQGEYQQNVVAPAQQTFQNRYSSYLNDNARTLNDYLQNYNIQHTADSDYWNRLKDVSALGEDAAKNDRAA